MQLLTSQKNQLLEIIRDDQLDPFNFEWKDRRVRYPGYSTGTYIIPTLEFKGTDYFYGFDKRDDGHEARFSPGQDTYTEHVLAGSWENQIYHFHLWLQHLKREIHSPDMWARLSQYNLPTDSADYASVENQQFTTGEVRQLQDGLKRMRSYLESEFDFSEIQINIVNEKLDYLLEAAKRQGKKDWLHTAIGAIFSLSVSLALAPEQATRIWGILRESIRGVVKLLN